MTTLVYGALLYVLIFALMACGRTVGDSSKLAAPTTVPKAEQPSPFALPVPNPNTSPAAELQVVPTPMPVVAYDSTSESAGVGTEADSIPQYGSGQRRYYGEATLVPFQSEYAG